MEKNTPEWREKLWPPRINRKHFATAQTFWIDSMGERHMTALAGSTQVLVWVQVNGADRFERISNGGETEAKR